MVIYTRMGDEGTTSRYDGSRIQKDDPSILLLGKLDSLQSGLDIARVAIRNKEIYGVIVDIQAKLWQLAGEISLGGIGKNINKPISSEDITLLEKTIDRYEYKGTAFLRFSNNASVALNEARVRCRDLESYMTQFFRDGVIRKDVYAYINRLSDLLFTLASYLNNR